MSANLLGSLLAVVVGAGALAPAAAQSVLFSPKIVPGSAILTGVEARLRFHLQYWDASLTGNLNEGNVGPTAEISNDPATLLNTVYDFKLDFATGTGGMTWTISGGALTSPVVLAATENDAFNGIRFVARALNGPHTLTFSDLVFEGLPGTGTLRTSGSVTNRTDGQRIVAAPGYMLSDFDWSLSGKVVTDGTVGSNTKIWIASHVLELDPKYGAPPATSALRQHPLPVSQVPEPSTLAMSALGLLGLLAAGRVGPRTGLAPASQLARRRSVAADHRA